MREGCHDASLLSLKTRVIHATPPAALTAMSDRSAAQRGWAGLGAGIADEAAAAADGALLIGAVPHDWLFERCCAVVHHGGAGTTAAGLHSGKGGADR